MSLFGRIYLFFLVGSIVAFLMWYSIKSAYSTEVLSKPNIESYLAKYSFIFGVEFFVIGFFLMLWNFNFWYFIGLVLCKVKEVFV